MYCKLLFESIAWFTNSSHQEGHSMSDVAIWLQGNVDSLINEAVIRLSQDEALKSQVVESVERFFNDLIQAASTHDSTLLNTTLIDWVKARSAPTDVQSTSLVPVLATLKEVTWRRILNLCAPN